MLEGKTEEQPKYYPAGTIVHRWGNFYGVLSFYDGKPCVITLGQISLGGATYEVPYDFLDRNDYEYVNYEDISWDGPVTYQF